MHYGENTCTLDRYTIRFLVIPEVLCYKQKLSHLNTAPRGTCQYVSDLVWDQVLWGL